MIILKNHFRHNTTYIVGTLIQNGCQTFPIDQLDQVCDKWLVPASIREQVLSLYEENSKVEEDWEALAVHADIDVRSLLGAQGQMLNILADDNSWVVRRRLAFQGHCLDKLKHDECLAVLCAVAVHGDIEGILVNHPNWKVRITLANHGHCLDILKDDRDEMVRIAAMRNLKLSH